jgi:hypothetical protein
MIGLMVDAGDHFKKRAAIPLAPCMYELSRGLDSPLLSFIKIKKWPGKEGDVIKGKKKKSLAVGIIKKSVRRWRIHCKV